MLARELIAVVGASGFGREALDVLEAMISAGADFDVVGVVDDAPSEANLERLQKRGVAYLGTIDTWLAVRTNEKYVLGIGSPAVKMKLAAKLDAAGAIAISAVHPGVTVGAMTTVAEGVVVCAGAAISNNVTLDRHVHLNPNVTIGHDVSVREFTSINPGATVSGDVYLGRGVLVGACATILQGLSVGEHAVIGAAALVTKDIPERVVVMGVPGRWK